MRLRRQVLKLALLSAVSFFIPYFLRRNFMINDAHQALHSTDLTIPKLNAGRSNRDGILQNTSKSLRHHFIDKHNSNKPPIREYFPVNDENNDGLKAAMEYCNSPLKERVNQEGGTVEGFRLRNIHVFINHGDSTSNHRSDWFGSELFNCKFRTWYMGNNTKFTQFPELMDSMAGKQGMRNHFLNWALYPDKDICADSMLTSMGALQHLQLGESLFQSYHDHKSLFNKKLSLTSQMFVKSTMSSRVYQSTVAFLFGFLPRFNISIMKIDNSPDLHFCTRQFSVQKSCYCRYANKLKIKAVKLQSKLKGYNGATKKHFDVIKEMFGDKTLPSDTVIAEAIIPFFCHNITLPCMYSMSTRSCQQFVGDLWNAVIAQEMAKYKDIDLNYLKYSSIVMTPIIIEILNRIKNVVENRQTPKFVLYSGQESTLSSLLYVLGLQDGKWPQYASRVVIELHEQIDNITYNRFYLRILYNGLDRTEDVIFCKRLTYKGLCSLSHFIDFVFTKMLRRFGFNSYYDACSR